LELARINGIIWDLKNELRENNVRDKKFITISKKISNYNETKTNIKNDINLITGSDYLETKEYTIKND
jgi:hypothetical protein